MIMSTLLIQNNVNLNSLMTNKNNMLVETSKRVTPRMFVGVGPSVQETAQMSFIQGTLGDHIILTQELQYPCYVSHRILTGLCKRIKKKLQADLITALNTSHLWVERTSFSGQAT